MNLYDFKVKAQDGSEVLLSDYRGKVVLVVNTATGCGFTPQYEELQNIYEEFKGEGFEILDFPCNQFGNQAPGTDDEIHNFCTGRFGINFLQFAKVDIKGDNAIPLYKWLTENSKFEGFDKNPMGMMLEQMLKKQDKDFETGSAVKWNFTKFLIDREGQIVARFEPMTPLKKVKDKINDII